MDPRGGGCCGEDHRRSVGAADRRAHRRQRRHPHGRPAGGGRRHARAADLHRHPQVLRRQELHPAGAGDPVPGDAGRRSGSLPEHVVVHAAYVLNTATTDEEKWGRASAGLRKELERSTALGVGAVCFHPGAATGGDRAEAVAPRGPRHHLGARGGERHAPAFWWRTPPGPASPWDAPPTRSAPFWPPCPPRSDRGPAMGSTPAISTPRGTTSPARRRRSSQVLDEFEAAAGAPPSFFHLNDSEGGLGSNKDRHLLLGEGRIGGGAVPVAAGRPAERGGPSDPGDSAATLRDRRGGPLSRSLRRPDDGPSPLLFATVLIFDRRRLWPVPGSCCRLVPEP